MEYEKIKSWNDIDGDNTQSNRLRSFLESESNTYAIFQLRDTEEGVRALFMSYSSLLKMGMEPDFDRYEAIYVGDLPPYTDRNAMLEMLYEKFNLDHPSDFTGHSLSVSDIVALKTNGIISWHYVDSIGFKDLPEFFKSQDHLKTAEMCIEDDYSMLDGIINNGSKDEKPSVLEQLKLSNQEQSAPSKLPKAKEFERE